MKMKSLSRAAMAGLLTASIAWVAPVWADNMNNEEDDGSAMLSLAENNNSMSDNVDQSAANDMFVENDPNQNSADKNMLMMADNTSNQNNPGGMNDNTNTGSTTDTNANTGNNGSDPNNSSDANTNNNTNTAPSSDSGTPDTATGDDDY